MPMIHEASRLVSRLLNGRTRTATFTDDIVQNTRWRYASIYEEKNIHVLSIMSQISYILFFVYSWYTMTDLGRSLYRFDPSYLIWPYSGSVVSSQPLATNQCDVSSPSLSPSILLISFLATLSFIKCLNCSWNDTYVYYNRTFCTSLRQVFPRIINNDFIFLSSQISI